MTKNVSVMNELNLAREALARACRHLKEGDGPEQVVLFDLAYMAAALEVASAMVPYAERGEVESNLPTVFVADALHEIRLRLAGRSHLFGVEEGAVPGLPVGRDPSFLSDLAGEPGPSHLDEDFVIVRDTFRRFADE